MNQGHRRGRAGRGRQIVGGEIERRAGVSLTKRAELGQRRSELIDVGRVGKGGVGWMDLSLCGRTAEPYGGRGQRIYESALRAQLVHGDLDQESLMLGQPALERVVHREPYSCKLPSKKDFRRDGPPRMGGAEQLVHHSMSRPMGPENCRFRPIRTHQAEYRTKYGIL